VEARFGGKRQEFSFVRVADVPMTFGFDFGGTNQLLKIIQQETGTSALQTYIKTATGGQTSVHKIDKSSHTEYKSFHLK
jgi:hypothetical protein